MKAWQRKERKQKKRESRKEINKYIREEAEKERRGYIRSHGKYEVPFVFILPDFSIWEIRIMHVVILFVGNRTSLWLIWTLFIEQTYLKWPCIYIGFTTSNFYILKIRVPTTKKLGKNLWNHSLKSFSKSILKSFSKSIFLTFGWYP